MNVKVKKFESTENEEKIARICWNTFGWQKPSGKDGKSKNKKSFEMKNGFGHEEWLSDTSKMIEGYHYACLQGIAQHRNKYIGKVYNISLYSINSNTKQRWWIGKINNVKVVTPSESQKIFRIYKKNGCFKEMTEQIRNVGATYSEFLKSNPNIFVAIKFKLEDLNLMHPPVKFSRNDSAITVKERFKN